MATTHKYSCDSNKWTYGAELELVDWPNSEPLMPGMAIDEAEHHNVNSNGVAVDGKGKAYHLGGEILTVPSESAGGPVDQFDWIMHRWPETTSNYRSGLNIHVRVPGLRDDLSKLKRLQTFIHLAMPELLPIIDPISWPAPLINPRMSMKNYKKRLRDHHTLLSKRRLEVQMKARTPLEFFQAEVVHEETGKFHWAIVPRNCVNLRQLMQTDTVEFRHFFMPKTPEELLNATLWCKAFLEEALGNVPSVSCYEGLLKNRFDGKAWPKCEPYDAWLDEGWHYTSLHNNRNSVELVKTHIEKWLKKREDQDSTQKYG